MQKQKQNANSISREQTQAAAAATQRARAFSDFNRVLISFDPLFNSLLLHVPRAYNDSADYVARTDGDVIRFGRKLLELKDHTKMFWGAYDATLKIALRLQTRARDLNFYHNRADLLALWNLCCDIICSAILSDYKVITPIYKTLSLSDLIAEGIIENRPNGKWTTEALFAALLKTADSTLSSIEGFDVDNVENSKLKNELKDYLEGKKGNIDPKPYGETKEMLRARGQLDSDPTIVGAQWSNLLQSALSAGTHPLDASLNLLLENLPKVSVPWKQLLSSLVREAIPDKRVTNPNRPNRLFMSGATNVYSPGKRSPKRPPLIVLAFDLSGSCFEKEIFTEFVANVEAIQLATKSQVLLLFFDAEVKSPTYLIDYNTPLSERLNNREIIPKGGGGTSFVEPIAYIFERDGEGSYRSDFPEAPEPSAVIVLTDCYGPFPPQPLNYVKTIWACNADAEAPWGHTIKLDSV